jgi:hypothetical protein
MLDRKYLAQIKAEDAAEKEYGQDFYSLPEELQAKLYGEALRDVDETAMNAALSRAEELQETRPSNPTTGQR